MVSRLESPPESLQYAPVIASATALVLVLIKVVAGFYSGSMVLIASAVDSGLDFLVSVFNFVAIRHSEKPTDEFFNYGRGKIEGLAAVFEGLIIAGSSVLLVVSAMIKLIARQPVEHTDWAILVMVVSILMTASLTLFLSRLAKRSGSLVLQSDALHYKVDLWTNLGIIAALALISQTGWHFIDPLFSILIALIIFKETFKLLKSGTMMLLDRALPGEITQQIRQILEQASPTLISSYHRLKTRQSAAIFFVDVHLVFDTRISLLDAHANSEKIENQIRKLRDCRWEFNCHLDPVDDSQRDARF